MNRTFLLLGAVPFLIVFVIITSYMPSFAGAKAAVAQSEVEIPLIFSEDDNGNKKAEPKDKAKWKEISKEKVLDAVGSKKPNLVEMWKINPCYVCSGGQCFMMNPC